MMAQCKPMIMLHQSAPIDALQQNQHHTNNHHNHQHYHHHQRHPAAASYATQHRHNSPQSYHTTSVSQHQLAGAMYQQHQAVAPPTPPSEHESSAGSFAQQAAPAALRPNWPLEHHQHQANATYTTNCHHQHQQPATQATPIASYYYDIDDEFSDILSAPPTPEPANLQLSHIHSLGPQAQQPANQGQRNPAPLSLEQQYQHYLPYNSSYDTPGAHYNAPAMSPDSSSLSTTSSSPSDHSLYQHSGLALASAGELSVAAGSPAQPVAVAHRAPALAPTRAPTNQHQLAQHHRSSPIHLWEFLRELLQQVDAGCADAGVIRWLDRPRGVFKIEDSVRVAKLWGKRKNKPKMNYDKLSRSIRQYYKKGIMKKTDRSQRLVYQFCSAYCH